MSVAAFVSFRLGGTDGVSVEAAKWAGSLRQLGVSVITVAGEGPVDHLIPGLAITASEPPRHAALENALADVDLVVIENLCSLPLNPAAASVVADVCRDRPTLLHHHDLSWQRPHLASDSPPPDDPAWRHVTINRLSTVQLSERGIEATTIYNCFETSAFASSPSTGSGEGPPDRLAARQEVRADLGVSESERLVLQPTRAIPRKNVPGGLAMAESLGATFWLLGPAEDGFDQELEVLLRGAGCRVLHGAGGTSVRTRVEDAYAACDLVVLPSTWEGFGNPAIESAVHRRPLVIGPYPVAEELEQLGFTWFHLDEEQRADQWLADPDLSIMEKNFEVANAHFSLRDLPGRLLPLLEELGVETPGHKPDY